MTLKSQVLSILEQNRGGSVSGQSIADAAGVSRNAVWKAVDALRNEGYAIDSAENRGYCLRADSDRLSAEGIRARLHNDCIDLHIDALPSVDSTNNEAKRRLAAGERRSLLIVAETQTGGRGRQGKRFYSPPGTGLYLTLVLHPDAPLSDATFVTTMAAVAVVRAIERLTDKRPLIKWVNDVYLNEKKICGILSEAVSDFESGTAQSVIIGIGLNVRAGRFPEDVAAVAGALEAENVTRNELAAEIARQLTALCANLADRSCLDDYRAHSMVIGRPVACIQNGVVRDAVALGVDESGGLCVRYDDGAEEVLRSGEISLRLRKD